MASLTFPESGYIGIAADFAQAYSHCYESPREFFYVDFLTYIGASISGRWQADFDLPCQPRLYTLKIAPSAWKRKSTSLRLTDDFMRELKVPGAARIVYGVGSAEGLTQNMAALSAAAGCPIDISFGRPNRRVLLYQDEFRRLEAKAEIKSSALRPMINEMYESNRYSNHTKHSPIEITDGHLSLISNTTTASYEKLLNAAESREIGFLNRLFLVTGNTDKKIARPKRPHDSILGPIRRRTAELFEMLPPLIDGHADPIIVPLTPEADALWCAWYESLEESDDTARLDNIGMRLLGGLSFVNGQREIDTKLVQSTIDILEYEKRVRQEIRPIDGDSPLAKQEQRIIAALKKHDAPMSERDLRRYANADYHGWKLHCDAEQSLVRAGV
ncbi:MAG: DUF3987 domain-containing protein, partial [Candidatus Acidiferrales bacterium]